MTSDRPNFTGIRGEPERPWVVVILQLLGTVVLAGVLVFRAVRGGLNGSTIGIAAVAVGIALVAAPVVVGRARTARATVARARRGSKVMVGYATPDLGEVLAAYGIGLPGAARSSALVALVFGRDTLEVVSAKGPASLVVLDWSAVTSLTTGRSLLGGRQQPTVQIDIFNAARIAVIPAVGTWWSTLIPTKDVTARLVQNIESIRKAAVGRAAADAQA